MGLPLNRVIDTGIIIAGSCFICGLGAGNFADLPPGLMERFTEGAMLAATVYLASRGVDS